MREVKVVQGGVTAGPWVDVSGIAGRGEAVAALLRTLKKRLLKSYADLVVLDKDGFAITVYFNYGWFQQRYLST